MNWNDVPVLVTGGGGFIGSHVVEALAAQGARVRAFLRYTSRPDPGLLRFLPPDLLGRVDIVRGDLRDPSAVLDAMHGCDWVFHLGALIGIPYSYVHPREVVETNVLGTFNVLEAARVRQPARVVHTSTSEVYGTALSERIREDHRLQGQSPYSATKIGADKLVESYHRSFGVRTVTVRPFNTYGPRQSARAVVPAIIVQGLTAAEVRIGATFPTRDFTFVRDTVNGLLSAAESDAAIGTEINLGTDQEISIGDLAAKIVGMIGRAVRITLDERRLRPADSEIQRLHADTARAADLLRWRPTVGLDQGLRETIAWIADHLGMYRPDEYEV